MKSHTMRCLWPIRHVVAMVFLAVSCGWGVEPVDKHGPLILMDEALELELGTLTPTDNSTFGTLDPALADPRPFPWLPHPLPDHVMLPSEDARMVDVRAPSWLVSITSIPGHVDALDLLPPDDLLRVIRLHRKQQLLRRSATAKHLLPITAWEQPPTLDRRRGILRWSLRLGAGDDRMVEAHVAFLGANSNVHLCATTAPHAANDALHALTGLIDNFQAHPDQRYQDFDPARHQLRLGGLLRFMIHPYPEFDTYDPARAVAGGHTALDILGWLMLVGGGICIALSARRVRTPLDEFTMRCPACAQPVEPFDRRCGACGASLAK